MGRQVAKHGSTVLLLIFLASFLSCGGQQAQRNQVLAKASRGIGEAYMRQGDYTAALSKLLEAERLYPEDHIVHHDLGLCYRAKNRMQDALDHLKKSVALKPGYSVARNTLGRVYLEMGDYDLAITTLKELTHDALYATPHYPLSNMGEAYFNKQDFNSAVAFYKQALTVQPDFIPALHGMGRTYVALARGRLAIIYLEKALKLSPNIAQIHFDAAEAYEQMGRRNQARVSYQSVVDLAGDESELILKAKNRLRMLR